MGAWTRGTIVSEGGLQAGDTSLSTRMNAALNAWLRSVYGAWPWPFLQRRKSGLSLTTGATSVTVGDGNGGVTPQIQRIVAPVYVYNSAYSKRGRALIRQLTGGPIEYDESANDSSEGRGMPTLFKVRGKSTGFGIWDLIPSPVPDETYLLAFDYIESPDDLSSDNDVPLYPNDRTMVQLVMSEVLKYKEGADSPAYQQALQVLASMVGEDRSKFGIVPGTNDLIQLDPDVFR